LHHGSVKVPRFVCFHIPEALTRLVVSLARSICCVRDDRSVQILCHFIRVVVTADQMIRKDMWLDICICGSGTFSTSVLVWSVPYPSSLLHFTRHIDLKYALCISPLFLRDHRASTYSLCADLC
jgi:hypothetical protein